MTGAIVALIIVLGLFLSAFFSGAETGLYGVNRVRLRLGVHRGDRVMLRLSRVLDDEKGALSVTLIGTNLANYVTTLAVTYGLADVLGFSERGAEIYTIVLLTPVVFVFSEMVPKTLFQLHPDRLLATGSVLLSVSNRVFRATGLVWILARMTDVANRLVGLRNQPDSGFDPKRRVTQLLQEALAGHSGSAQQSALIDRVCRLSETPVHAVMVPRNRVKVISATCNRRELIRAVRRTGHSRLPVYDRHPRSIIGIVKVDELLNDNDWKQVSERLRPALALRPHETVANALSRMQEQRRGMAVVTDQAGQLLGVVAMKDLLREVVGEMAAGV